MDIKKSAIKDILDERRHERTMDKVGTIIISFIFGIATGLMMTAYFISLTLR